MNKNYSKTSIAKKNDNRKTALTRGSTSLPNRKSELNRNSAVNKNKKDDRPDSSKKDKQSNADTSSVRQSPRPKEDNKSSEDEEKRFECHGPDRDLADMLGVYHVHYITNLYLFTLKTCGRSII